MSKEKKLGFKVAINNELFCRAGFQNKHSIVTCILDSVWRKNETSEESHISVGGLNSDTKQHVDWFKRELREGDIISIEVISNNFDEPKSIREPKPEKELLKRKLRNYYKLKEELKDYLDK
jgi:hypothetical protein